MMDFSTLYQFFNFPESTYLGSKIFKKQFYENAQLTTQDKIAFKDDVESIIWRNTLKPNTINIPTFKKTITDNNENINGDSNQSYNIEYLEIAIIEVTLKQNKRHKRIAEIIQRAIPYPTLIVFLFNNEQNTEEFNFSLNLAIKRMSKADNSKLTVERFYNTQWFSLSNTNSNHIKNSKNDNSFINNFLENLTVSKQSTINFYEFYLGWINQFLNLEKIKYQDGSTEINSSSNATESNIKFTSKLLDEISSLEDKLQAIRNNIKKEQQINLKVELNIKAQNVKHELNNLKRVLAGNSYEQ